MTEKLSERMRGYAARGGRFTLKTDHEDFNEFTTDVEALESEREHQQESLEYSLNLNSKWDALYKKVADERDALKAGEAELQLYWKIALKDRDDWQKRAESAEAELDTLKLKYAGMEQINDFNIKECDKQFKRAEKAEAEVKTQDATIDELRKDLYKTCGEVVDLEATKPSLESILRECKHYRREEINLVLDGKTPPITRCKDCGKILEYSQLSDYVLGLESRLVKTQERIDAAEKVMEHCYTETDETDIFKVYCRLCDEDGECEWGDNFPYCFKEKSLGASE